MRLLNPVCKALVFLGAVMPGSGASAQEVPARLFPKSNEIPGWEITSGPTQYPENKLFEYMDGAAEIPKSYGFRALGSAKYKKGAATLEVAIFDMGSAANAYGFYSARVFLEHSPRSREKVIKLAHPAHLYVNVGVLTFWQDKYTVILQPVDTAADESSLTSFAKHISGVISGKGAEPALVSKLPQSKQKTGTSRYIVGKAAFDATVMFAARDLFGMAQGPQAAAAEYDLAGGELTLVIIKYSDSDLARQAFSRFTTMMLAGKVKAMKSSIAGAFVGLTAGRAKGVALAAQGSDVFLVVGASTASAADNGLVKLIKGIGK